MRATLFLALALAFIALASQAQTVDWTSVWGSYDIQTHRLCPSHKLNDFSDGQYDEVLNRFLERYPALTQARIAKIVDYSKNCAAETAGFSCEFGANLNAFQRVGLLHEFVAYSCRHWRCEYAAMCKWVP